MKNYFRKLLMLWTRPGEFYSAAALETDSQPASNFAALTAILVAVELGLQEALSGGTLSIVAFVTVALLIALPFGVLLSGFLWAGFIRLTASLLGADLPFLALQKLVFYSCGGLAAMALAFLVGKWAALAVFFFQVAGSGEMLSCSKVSAYVYVLLPASMFGVLGLVLALLFKVF